MEHELKTISDLFWDIKNRIKKFEIRINDRGFKVGDTLKLREIDRDKEYTGQTLIVEVTYLLDINKFISSELQDKFVVMGIDFPLKEISLDRWNWGIGKKDSEGMWVKYVDAEKLIKELMGEIATLMNKSS